MRLAAAALNQTPLDWLGNQKRIESAIDQAREAKVDCLVLPELCITGYGCEDMFLAPGVQHKALELLFKLAKNTKNLVVSFGLPLEHKGNLYNVAALVSDRKILGFAAKHHLAKTGIHYEQRWFSSWPLNQMGATYLRGKQYPIGHFLFEVDGQKVGYEICEDAWLESRIGDMMCQKGADIILNPSASHFALGKQDLRRDLILDLAKKYDIAYVYANLLGNESGRIIYDGGNIIANRGLIVAEGERFSYREVRLTVADTDKVSPANLSEWESDPELNFQEFSRAVSLGLFDYLRKSRSSGVVVSLSGGVDSASVASLARLAFRLANQELGFTALSRRLSYNKRLSDASDEDELVYKSTSCVYQATQHSSETTYQAALAVSKAIGARWFELDVENIVQSYITLVEKKLGYDLNWKEHDTAMQNIQARVRSPGVWLVANSLGALLLTTSNRSEAAVGYATMDGDMSGGLAPIAGIGKSFLRGWLRWLERGGIKELGPVSALRLVNQQEPTAELRPRRAQQSDEKDLMPFDVLEYIERQAVGEKHMPQELWKQLPKKFPQYSRDDLREWLVRFFKMWSRNQWKRERMAPTFHLDDHSLDPKSWCRFPILSSSFEKELAEIERPKAT